MKWETARTCVYDVYAGDDLIYVGASRNPTRRLRDHKSSGLIPATATIKIVRWYTNHAKAMAAESRRIARLKPRLNVAGFADRGHRAAAATRRLSKQMEQWEQMVREFEKQWID